MSSLELPALFGHLTQPLNYAERLLAHFAELARSRDKGQLQLGLVQATSQLTGGPLSQLYLLYVTHTPLTLAA